mgnify:CR=1 FL=1
MSTGPAQRELLPPDKRAFMDVARDRGMRAAIAWRDERFARRAAVT